MGKKKGQNKKLEKEKNLKKAKEKKKARENKRKNVKKIVKKTGKKVIDKPKKGSNPQTIDIRIGKVLSVKDHRSAKKLFVEEIDVGDKKPRIICSGLKGKIDKEKLEGALVIVMCNLKPMDFKGIKSNGMVMVAHKHDEEGKEVCSLVKIPEGAEAGDRVEYEGLAECDPARMVTQQVFEDLLQFFKSNDKSEVCWYNHKMKIDSGTIMTEEANMTVS